MQATPPALVLLISLHAAGAPPPVADNAAVPRVLVVEVAGARAAPTQPATPPPAALQTYSERCAVCHGARGAGDGPAAKGLMTKPRRFSDAIWQQSVDDTHIAKAILEGGFAVKKSSAMPAHPDLKATVAGLVQVVRSFRNARGTVVVEALGGDGKPAVTATADLDERGRAQVPLQNVQPGTLAVTVRASGVVDPVCVLQVAVTPDVRSVSCSPTAAPGP